MYKNELYHYGVLGMKWGVRRYQKSIDKHNNRKQKMKEKKLDGYGNVKKGNILLRPHFNSLDKRIDQIRKDRVNLRDDSDNNSIDFETSNMNAKQKKIYSLNYYNDKKMATKLAYNEAVNFKNKMNSIDGKTKTEQYAIDLMGSNFLNKFYDTNISDLQSDSKHYATKVDALLKDMKDVKLSTIKSKRSMGIGSTTYSWYGDEYIERQ